MKNENAVLCWFHEALRKAALSLLERRLLRCGFRMDKLTLALSRCVDRLDAEKQAGAFSDWNTICVKEEPTIYYMYELDEKDFSNLL